jgi:hypothetical protein
MANRWFDSFKERMRKHEVAAQNRPVEASAGTHDSNLSVSVSMNPDGSSNGIIVSTTNGKQLTQGQVDKIKTLFPVVSAQRSGIQYVPPAVEWKEDMSFDIDISTANAKAEGELEIIIAFMDQERRNSKGKPLHRANERRLKTLLTEREQRQQNRDLPMYKAKPGDIKAVYEVIRNRKQFKEEQRQKIAEHNKHSFMVESRYAIDVATPESFVTFDGNDISATIKQHYERELDKKIVHGISAGPSEETKRIIAESFGVPKGLISPNDLRASITYENAQAEQDRNAVAAQAAADAAAKKFLEENRFNFDIGNLRVEDT